MSCRNVRRPVELELRFLDGAIPVVTSFRDLASNLACY